MILLKENYFSNNFFKKQLPGWECFYKRGLHQVDGIVTGLFTNLVSLKKKEKKKKDMLKV